jgi:hypothetical protein
MDFTNINRQEEIKEDKFNVSKKGLLPETFSITNTNKIKKHQTIKDQVIITRAQEAHLHLLNKLSLRLLRQKYGQ